MNMLVRLGLLVPAVAVIAACGGEVRSPDFTPVLQRIDISPVGPATLVEQDTLQLTATAFFTTPPSQGNVLNDRDVTDEVTWTSDNSTVATISPSGLLTAQTPGSLVTITAALQGVADTFGVTVIAGTLTDIVIYDNADCTGNIVRTDVNPNNVPATNRLLEGTTQQYGATPIFRRDSSQGAPIVRDDCQTAAVSWQSGDDTTLCVESEVAPAANCDELPDPAVAGRAFGVNVTPAGQSVSLTAQFMDNSGNSVSTTAPIFITNPTLQSLFLCPDAPSATSCSGGAEIASGDALRYRAYAMFSDGVCRNVTGLAGDPATPTSTSQTLNVTAATNAVGVRVENYIANNDMTGGIAGIRIATDGTGTIPDSDAGDPFAMVDPGLCAAPGPFSTTGSAVTINATIPQLSNVTANSVVGVLDAQINDLFVCPEDRDNPGQCQPCVEGMPGNLDCHLTDTLDDFVGEGLQRQFLARARFTDGTSMDVTRSDNITWSVSAMGIAVADLGSVQAATGLFTATANAVDRCRAEALTPCAVGVNASLTTADVPAGMVDGTSTVDIVEVQAQSVTITSDPTPPCIFSTDPLNLLGDETQAQLTASVNFVAVDVDGNMIPGSEFTEPDFMAAWEATTGQWDGTMCTPGLSLPTDPADVSATGTVSPAGPAAIGQACVTGTARNDPADPDDDVFSGITVAVDVVGLVQVNCMAIGG